MFQNLVINAIEAMVGIEFPHLKITTETEGRNHKTIIEDNGYGMDDETKKHAFEPFFSTKELDDGRQRGLGLFNVWRLVEQHNGSVKVKSTPGVGSKIEIIFMNANFQIGGE